jgi:hypothetical protein
MLRDNYLQTKSIMPYPSGFVKAVKGNAVKRKGKSGVHKFQIQDEIHGVPFSPNALALNSPQAGVDTDI